MYISISSLIKSDIRLFEYMGSKLTVYLEINLTAILILTPAAQESHTYYSSSGSSICFLRLDLQLLYFRRTQMHCSNLILRKRPIISFHHYFLKFDLFVCFSRCSKLDWRHFDLIHHFHCRVSFSWLAFVCTLNHCNYLWLSYSRSSHVFS